MFDFRSFQELFRSGKWKDLCRFGMVLLEIDAIMA